MRFARRRWRNISFTIVVAITLIIMRDVADAALYRAAFLTGWLLFAAVLVLSLYRARKAVTAVPIGSAASWFQFHACLGAISIVLFLLHVGWRIPDGWFEVFLAVLFVLVALSGIVGIVLLRIIPRRLTRRGEEVILERIPIFIADLRREAEQLVLDSTEQTESSTIGDYYLDELGDFFRGPRNTLHHLVASNRPLFSILTEIDDLERYLNDEEREFAKRMRELVEKKDDLDFHYALNVTLRAWLFVHVPLTYGLLVLAVAHVVLVHAFGGGL